MTETPALRVFTNAPQSDTDVGLNLSDEVMEAAERFGVLHSTPVEGGPPGVADLIIPEWIMDRALARAGIPHKPGRSVSDAEADRFAHALGAVVTEEVERRTALAGGERTGYEALDAQLRLLSWYSSTPGERTAQAFMRALASDQREEVRHRTADQLTSYFLNTEVRRLDTGATFLVSAEMADLAAWASRDLPDDFAMTQDLLAEWPRGFMVIEGNVLTKDVSDRTIAVRAISWGADEVIQRRDTGEGRPGVGVTFYSDSMDARDDQHTELAGLRPQLAKVLGVTHVPREELFHITGLFYGDTVAEWDTAIQEATQHSISQTWAGYGADVPINLFRWVLATWRLMGEPVAHVNHRHQGRAAQRRQQRASAAPDPGVVRVVTLRREREHVGNGDSTEREAPLWTHRWAVRGHWRRITHKDGTVSHTWVNPYIKGPEDRPFIPKDRVYRWAR